MRTDIPDTNKKPIEMAYFIGDDCMNVWQFDNEGELREMLTKNQWTDEQQASFITTRERREELAPNIHARVTLTIAEVL